MVQSVAFPAIHAGLSVTPLSTPPDHFSRFARPMSVVDDVLERFCSKTQNQPFGNFERQSCVLAVLVRAGFSSYLPPPEWLRI
jgi:hypothetical protein